MASKWYYLVQTVKQVWFNLLCNQKDLRQWMMSEEDHEQYKQLWLENKTLKAEKDMWYKIADANARKITFLTEWINVNWESRNNEK